MHELALEILDDKVSGNTKREFRNTLPGKSLGSTRRGTLAAENCDRKQQSVRQFLLCMKPFQHCIEIRLSYRTPRLTAIGTIFLTFLKPKIRRHGF